MQILHLFRTPGVTDFVKEKLQKKWLEHGVNEIQTECCFNIDCEQDLSTNEFAKLSWLLSETFEPQNFNSKTFLKEVRSFD
jgi:phosphoribosylformylglycinamidine synthase